MITLHHAPQSRSFRILWFLHEAGLAHHVTYHSFGGKGLRDPAFLALSPAGRVPVVEVDDQVLFESAAILEYLVETRAPALGRAAGHSERGQYLEWLHYGETIAQHLAQLTFHHIVLRREDRSPVVQRLEALRLRRTLEGIEAALGDQDYILHGGFSAADVMIGSSTDLARRFVPLTGLPRVQAWHQRLTARPAYQAALAADGPAELYLHDTYGDARG
ncbi:glutathione S-transferase family protein [Pararhodobacter oceanensis]|uniref:Glutathione S-transferase n=1 Tax=Pararhodobacter oceanensis TaxID=2172121 RepID=A0A2T8HQG3_9RHOB|nr:glutathione S-transferase family protein [Pararhodobacter oceanensis]PVH27663.1 glutathione S-transferase [Pararhodobacter oceanensis]